MKESPEHSCKARANTHNNPPLVYHSNPTKEELLEYFGYRIRVRKMVPKEAFRLQGVRDPDIEKIQAFPFTSIKEKESALAKADRKELNRIKRAGICKTAQFKLAGNSIDCKTLYHLFRSLLIPGQQGQTPASKSTAKKKRLHQMDIFEILDAK